MKTRDELIELLADNARHHAADAPEWRDQDTVAINVSIGDLRAALSLENDTDSAAT